MKKVVKVYRQGDCVIQPIDNVDLSKAEQIKPDNGRTILAYGEVTGHCHQLPAFAANQYKVGDREFLEVKKPAQLKHEEHAPIDLPAGLYEKKIAREYTPKGIVKVID